MDGLKIVGIRYCKLSLCLLWMVSRLKMMKDRMNVVFFNEWFIKFREI